MRTCLLTLTSHFSLAEPCIPANRPGVQLYHVLCVAGDAPIPGLGGADGNQLAVGGSAASTDPFGSVGGRGHPGTVPPREAASC
jgi:hypothetical protein